MTRSRITALTGAGVTVLAVCFALFGRSLPGSSPQALEQDRAAINAVLKEQQAAWNRGDVQAFLTGYWHSPELTFSGSNGVARGWDGVVARYKKNYPDRDSMGQLDFSDLETRFLGQNAALVLGKWHLKRETAGDIGGVFTLVWQKLPDGWKIIHDHTSTVSFPEPNP